MLGRWFEWAVSVVSSAGFARDVSVNIVTDAASLLLINIILGGGLATFLWVRSKLTSISVRENLRLRIMSCVWTHFYYLYALRKLWRAAQSLAQESNLPAMHRVNLIINVLDEAVVGLGFAEAGMNLLSSRILAVLPLLKGDAQKFLDGEFVVAESLDYNSRKITVWFQTMSSDFKSRLGLIREQYAHGQGEGAAETLEYMDLLQKAILVNITTWTWADRMIRDRFGESKKQLLSYISYVSDMESSNWIESDIMRVWDGSVLKARDLARKQGDEEHYLLTAEF